MQTRTMTFAEAESRFWQARGMRSSGRIDQATFESTLKELMVQGPDGRWWMPHQETGQWHVYDGASWVPATPPVSPPSAPPAAAWSPPPPPGQEAASLAPPAKSGAASGGSGMGLVLGFALAFWALVGIAVAVFVAPEAVLGVCAAALVSAVLIVKTYQESWEGTVERFETRRVRMDRGKGEQPLWRNQQLAIVRLTNGKTKELHPMPDWRVGDRLAKRRGEPSLRKL